MSIAPQKLSEIQKWFASIIMMPIDQCSRMNLVAPNGVRMDEEALKYISPGLYLPAEKRIELYNQQYWWRLLSILHEAFPLVVRLFGYEAFNQCIAMPYLVKYPSRHWSLDCLGKRLPQWIQEDYHTEDATLVYHSAIIDWAYQECFFADAQPPFALQGDDVSQELLRPLQLQPYLQLIQIPFHLLSFRDAFLKEEPEHWLKHDFPPLEKGKNYSFLIYRNLHYNIEWKELSEGEWFFLGLIQKGASLQQACDELEEQGGAIYEEAAENLALWIRDWTTTGWLT
jgi:hypothetical protein